MIQGQTRKKIIWCLAGIAIICVGGWFWSQSQGALFSPKPDVEDTVAVIPSSDATETVDVVVDPPVTDTTAIPDTSLPEVSDVIPEVVLETSPAPEPETAPIQDLETAEIQDNTEEMTGTPTFDVVRVEDDGTALIAGQTPMGGELFLLVDGTRMSDTRQEVGNGEQFVIFATLARGPKPLVLELEVEHPSQGSVVSDQKIFVAPRIPQVADVQAPSVEDVVEPEKPTVLMADTDGDVRVIGSPVAVVALDTIQYDLEGDVSLGGRAAGDGFVRVYLDNKPITTSKIEGSGFWSTSLPDVDTGVYTLRVDELDEDGSVTSRVETPFQRESPTALQAFAQPGSAYDVKAMTVQPGTTLWAMAVAKYGDGSQFMKVFEANKETISDPNLIFPGQIFDLPD